MIGSISIWRTVIPAATVARKARVTSCCLKLPRARVFGLAIQLRSLTILLPDPDHSTGPDIEIGCASGAGAAKLVNDLCSRGDRRRKLGSMVRSDR